MTSNNKPSIFLLPEDLMLQIEDASKLLGISKSELVRRCVRRDLDFVLQHEVATSTRHQKEVQTDHAAWIERGQQKERRLEG